MLYGLLADFVVGLHMAFVVFVLIGGLLALKWPWLVRLHLPAAAWGAIVEFSGWLCPLTPLENWLREQAGRGTYDTDFLGRYLLPLLYPADLTRDMQIVFGTIVLLVNAGVYALLWRRRYYETH
jgi:nitrate reductase gamma subunit